MTWTKSKLFPERLSKRSVCYVSSSFIAVKCDCDWIAYVVIAVKL